MAEEPRKIQLTKINKMRKVFAKKGPFYIWYYIWARETRGKKDVVYNWKAPYMVALLCAWWFFLARRESSLPFISFFERFLYACVLREENKDSILEIVGARSKWSENLLWKNWRKVICNGIFNVRKILVENHWMKEILEKNCISSLFFSTKNFTHFH